MLNIFWFILMAVCTGLHFRELLSGRGNYVFNLIWVGLTGTFSIFWLSQVLR